MRGALEIQLIATAVFFWAVAVWLARRGRNEFGRAMSGGPETAKTLTEESASEVLSHGIAFRDQSLCAESQRLQGKPSRDVYAWVKRQA